MGKVHNSEEKPAVPDQPATSKPPAQPAKPTASDILGLKQTRTKGSTNQRKAARFFGNGGGSISK